LPQPRSSKGTRRLRAAAYSSSSPLPCGNRHGFNDAMLVGHAFHQMPNCNLDGAFTIGARVCLRWLAPATVEQRARGGYACCWRRI